MIVAWLLSCWGCVGLGVLIGHFLWPRPETVVRGRHAPLRHTGSAPMKGGQVVMGPQQPRPQVQSRVPSAPPRGQGGISGGGHPRPHDMPTRGPSGPSGQAYGGPPREQVRIELPEGGVLSLPPEVTWLDPSIMERGLRSP